MSLTRPWHFQLDINGDGIFTVTDVFKSTGRLFFLPGDSLIYFTINEAPRVARFLELGRDSFHGILSGIISLIAWVLFLVIVLLIREAITRAWEKLSRRLSSGKAL